MLLAICKVLAVALWSASLVLMFVGLVESDVSLDFYAFACWLALAAMVPTAHVVVDHALEVAYERGRPRLAAAVGLAVAEELGRDAEIRPLH